MPIIPIELPPGRLHRFGVEPTDDYQRILIQHWWELDKTTVSPEGVAFAADAYDDCIADLDEQLGKLVDELDRRGVLEQTWLIIASDHGESFGEHAGVFCHGTSLYETELHVPLLIIPPGGATTKQVVNETVSLRDLAATIVDVAGPADGLAVSRGLAGAVLAGARRGGTGRTCPLHPRSPRWSRTTRRIAIPGVSPGLPPLGALKEDDWSYIRREGDVREELFHLSEDPGEQRNLAGDPAARTTLQQMRAALDRLTGGPLSPGRFRP